MITLYYSQSSKSCRCARNWLKKNCLCFKEVSLNKKSALSKKELMHILSLTEYGIEDIISKRSRIYKRLNIDFDNLTVNEVLDLINKHRSLLRRPLIVDEVRLQVGFNDDEIRKFIPRQVRNVQMGRFFY